MTDCVGMGVYLWREIFGQCLLVSNSIFLEYKEFTTIVHYSGFLDVQQMACNSPALIIYLAECNPPSIPLRYCILWSEKNWCYLTLSFCFSWPRCYWLMILMIALYFFSSECYQRFIVIGGFFHIHDKPQAQSVFNQDLYRYLQVSKILVL